MMEKKEIPDNGKKVNDNKNYMIRRWGNNYLSHSGNGVEWKEGNVNYEALRFPTVMEAVKFIRYMNTSGLNRNVFPLSLNEIIISEENETFPNGAIIRYKNGMYVGCDSMMDFLTWSEENAHAFKTEKEAETYAHNNFILGYEILEAPQSMNEIYYMPSENNNDEPEEKDSEDDKEWDYDKHNSLKEIDKYLKSIDEMFDIAERSGDKGMLRTSVKLAGLDTKQYEQLVKVLELKKKYDDIIQRTCDLDEERANTELEIDKEAESLPEDITRMIFSSFDIPE